MKKTIAIVYISAVLNLCGTSWIIGEIWWGWGEFLGDKSGLMLWALFLNSTVLAFGLLMIAIVKIRVRRVNKKEELIKRYEKKESDSNALSKSFLEESRRRNIDKLKRSEMKEFMVHFMFTIEQLSEQIEILTGRKLKYLEFVEDTIKSRSAKRDKDEREI